MAQFDPWRYSRPPKRAHTRTFIDPELGEGPTLTLRRLDNAEAMATFDVADKLIEEYITGNEATGEKPKPFNMLADGEPIKLSEAMIRNAVTIEAMQVPDGTGERPYNAKDLIAIFAVVNATTAGAIVKWVGQVQRGEADGVKNALSGVNPTTESLTDSSASTTDILNSTAEPMPSYGPSTSDSAGVRV